MELTITERLKMPFSPKRISWRVGSTNKEKTKGIALAYIDARDVMGRLDDIFGIAGWSDSYEETTSGRLICTLSVCLDGVWISKSDGAGDTQVEGEKGAISDAFKRVAVKYGIGRYLYELPTPWVDLDEYKKIKVIPKLPDWATPEWYMSYLEKKQAKVEHKEEKPTITDERYNLLLKMIVEGNYTVETLHASFALTDEQISLVEAL